MKHCIKLSFPIAYPIDGYIGDVIGPFDTIADAEAWYERLLQSRGWKINPPSATCTPLLNPNDD